MSLLTRTYRLRWHTETKSVRALGERIHDVVRAGVLAQTDRREPVVFVSCGLATPPGPTRLVLEDRRRGLPGRRFSAELRRDGAQVELSIRSSRLRSLPLELLDPLLRAVRAVAAPEAPSWEVA